MKIKTTTTTEAKFTMEDLKEILSEKLGYSKEDVDICTIYETQVMSGIVMDVFKGLKVTVKKIIL